MMTTQGDTPRCQTDWGCPVKYEAQNWRLQKLVDVYIKARGLMSYAHLIEYGKEILEKHGLNDPSLLFECEVALQKYLKFKAESESKTKSSGKKGIDTWDCSVIQAE